MEIGFVDQHRHVARDPVEQLGHLLLRHNPPGRVVGAAEVDHADVPVVGPDRRDHAGDVLPEIGEQRHLDLVGLERGHVLKEDVVGDVGADDLPVVLEEGGTDDVEDLAGARAEHDVFPLDAVVLGDFRGDASVGISVPVGVLHGPGHGLHHRFGGSVGIFVIGELGDLVVLVHRDQGTARRARLLGQQLSRFESEQAERTGDATDEAPPR